MSAFHFNLVEVEVKHGDCVPENKLGGNSTAWTKSYFVSSVQDFGKFSDFLEEGNLVAYSINRAKIKEYRLEFQKLFSGRLGSYPGKGTSFDSNCDYLITQSSDPIVELTVRVNGDRVFMKFADGRDLNAHAFRELLYDGLSKIILIENSGSHEMYPAILVDPSGLGNVTLEGSSLGEPQADECTIAGDRLSVALKLFKEQRDSWVDEHGKLVHELVNANVREQYADHKKWDAAKLYDAEEFKQFCMKQTWMLRNGNGSYQYIAKYSDGERKKLVDWIDQNVVQLKVPLAEVVVKNNGFNGVTNKAVTELLMKFHPDQFCLCNGPTMDALAYLGLDPAVDGANDYDAYLQVMGCCAKILSRLRQMKIGATLDGDAPADYLVVNEFIYFVYEKKNLIKEEVMKNEFRPVETTPKKGDRKLKDAVKDDEMMQRLMSALRTKPFAILAGHSGTGKSQLVRRLAYMTCNDEVLRKEAEKFNAPGNYCMVQVKPNWHDSTDLLGYYTEMGGGHYHTTEFVEFICKAYAYPNTPFFVCLDEMNLAPVEQYFAEFLSAIESYSEKTGLTDSLITENAPAEEVCGRTKLSESYNHVKEHKLTIPRNLFVVGTVNVDETTCQFSRKVLDRAMTLLMTTARFDSMTKVNDPSDEELIDSDGIAFFLERPTQATLVQGQMDWLAKVQQQVGDTAFAIAYRFANECALYQMAYQKLMGMGDDANDADAQKKAIDHTVLMKLLPRIHGTRAEVEAIFKGRESDPKKDGLIKALGEGQSKTMMTKILKRGGDYISFWP